MTSDILLQLADRFRSTVHSEKALEIIVGLITLKFIEDNAPQFQLNCEHTHFADMCQATNLKSLEDSLNLQIRPFTSALSLLESECSEKDQLAILNLVDQMALCDVNRSGWVADTVMHFLMSRNTTGGTAATATAPSVAKLLATIGSIGMPCSVSDPFLGMGFSTKEIKQILPEASVYGRDIAPLPLYYASLLQILMFNHDFRFELGNSLQSPITNTFDLILSAPPLGLSIDPKEVLPSSVYYPELLSRRGDWTFVQNALATLNPNGEAVLQLSMGPLFQTGKIANIRKNLLQAGHIKAIIQLPNGCWLSSNVSTCILIVTPKSNRNHVFLMDATAPECLKYFDRKLRQQTTISDEGIEYIRAIIENETVVNGLSRQVTYEELEATQFILTPEVYLKSQDNASMQWIPVTEILSQQRALYKELSDIKDNLADKIEQFKSL